MFTKREAVCHNIYAHIGGTYMICFSLWKLLNYSHILIDIYFSGYDLWEAIVGFDHVLMPNRQVSK